MRRFLDEEDFYLLDDFDKNQELIKDTVCKNIRFPKEKIDDLPYIIPLTRDFSVNLANDYAFIKQKIEEESAEVPLNAFFGNLTKPPVRKKKYPLLLLSQNANLDQLLAMHNSLKYPLSYIQGPPGTGKTSTIVNTIISAFFNEKTVLFSSFNNHPIDGVCSSLLSIQYRGKTIPFPIFRIGNALKMSQSLDFWKETYLAVKDISVYSDTLEKNKEAEIEKSKILTELLQRYEEKVNLEERKIAIEDLLKINSNMTYQFDLQGRQLANVNKMIENIGEIKNEDALELVNKATDKQLQYLYYTSVKCIKRLNEPKNKDLLEIIMMEDDERNERIKKFSAFLREEENVRRFIKVFSVIASTCISAGKIGTPEVYFDMTIIDEASQCDEAISLLPILRSK